MMRWFGPPVGTLKRLPPADFPHVWGTPWTRTHASSWSRLPSWCSSPCGHSRSGGEMLARHAARPRLRDAALGAGGHRRRAAWFDAGDAADPDRAGSDAAGEAAAREPLTHDGPLSHPRQPGAGELRAGAVSVEPPGVPAGAGHDRSLSEQCPGCGRSSVYDRTYRCPRCGTFNKRRYVREALDPAAEAGKSLARITAEYAALGRRLGE